MSTEHVRPTSGTGAGVTAGDVVLYVDDQGSCDVVVLLHGGIMDHQSWGNQIPVLAEHYRVIAPDTRAHGRSTDTDEPLTYEQFAADTAALVSALGVERASFVVPNAGRLLSGQYPDPAIDWRAATPTA